MSEEATSKMETNQTFLEKVIPHPLEKFITAALAKLKRAWSQENMLTGIQFYTDNDD
jgi:hypothetical protein